jgi:hypothetical protein
LIYFIFMARIKPTCTISLITTGKRAFTAAKQPKKEVLPWMDSKIIVAGCQGQIGVPLTRKLCQILGPENVIASDTMD